MVDPSPSSNTDTGSFVFDHNPEAFDSATVPVSAYAEYSFIAVLGLAQRLNVHFLPITWQAGLGLIGSGGHATIHQALLNAQTSLAFKRFRQLDQAADPFRAITQEITTLSHPVLRKHQHIVTLEGICWDILTDDRVWPVLVYEKSHFGDLHSFTKRKRFENLLLEDRLNLCADIGIALRDMHSNGIIHKDIKPRNVLVFEDNSRIIAKVTDFELSTCFQSHDELIWMSKSLYWEAPECIRDSYRGRTFEEAKQMEVYSFALVCFWLLFEAGSSSGLLLPPNVLWETGHFVSFERGPPDKNLIQLWKIGNKLVDWVSWLVYRDELIDSRTKDRLASFFRSTLTCEPGLRCTEFEQLLNLLNPHRVLPPTESIQIRPVPKEEDFQISLSIQQLYNADFRLREFITKSLTSIVSGSAESNMQRISPGKAALQLALTHTIGFGTAINDKRAKLLLNQYSLGHADYESQLERIGGSFGPLFPKESLFSRLEQQGYLQQIDFAGYYQERRLLRRAEANYKQEVKSIQLVFGTSHWLYLELMTRLAWIVSSQGRWKEAEELQVQVMKTKSRVFGKEHPSTLSSIANLASIYRNQGRWKEAAELEIEVRRTSLIILGKEHPSTLNSIANLALTYQGQKRWDKAEELCVQVAESRKRVLGEEHPDTLSSIGNLALIYQNTGRWGEAEELFMYITEAKTRVLCEEHSHMLIDMPKKGSALGSHIEQEGAKITDQSEVDLVTKMLGTEAESNSRSDLGSGAVQSTNLTSAVPTRLQLSLPTNSEGVLADSLNIEESTPSPTINKIPPDKDAETSSDRSSSKQDNISINVESGTHRDIIRNLSGSLLEDLPSTYSDHLPDSLLESRLPSPVLSETESEIESVASSKFSELSRSSVSSNASDLKNDVWVAALDEVIALFISDEVLTCLFTEAFLNKNPEKVSRSGVRLLRLLGLRFMAAAKIPAEKETARLFISRKRDQEIIDRIAEALGFKPLGDSVSQPEQTEEATRQEKAFKREWLTTYPHEQSGMLTPSHEPDIPVHLPAPLGEVLTLDDHGSDTSSDSGGEEKVQHKFEQPSIDTLRLTLKSSDAFVRFKEELEDFIEPFRNKFMWQKTLWTRDGRERVRFESSSTTPQLSRADQLKLAVQERLGKPILWWPFTQPRNRLPLGKVRIIWICGCGDEAYVDISSAKARRYRQACHTIPPNPIAGQSPIASSLASISNPILPTQSAAPSSSGGNHKFGASASALLDKVTNVLRPRQAGNRRAPNATSGTQQNANIANATQSLKYIHWCVDSAPSRTFLHHVCIEGKKGKELITDLYQGYKKLRGWRWFLSMTTCAEIRLVRLNRVYGGEDAVNCFYNKVLPDLSVTPNEYTYKNDPDLEEEVYVRKAERVLLDYYHGYRCCCKNNIGQFILGIPHRVRGNNFEKKGYGIWAKQGWTLTRLLAFGVATQSWALMFVAYWLWNHPGDLQNAFSPAYYTLGLVTVFVVVPDVFFT